MQLFNDTEHSIITIGKNFKFILAPKNDEVALAFFNAINIENSCLGCIGLVKPGHWDTIFGGNQAGVCLASMRPAVEDINEWLDKVEARFSNYCSVLHLIQEKIENPVSVRLSNLKHSKKSFDFLFDYLINPDLDINEQLLVSQQKIDVLKRDKNKLFNYPV